MLTWTQNKHRILPKDDEALEHFRQRQVLLVGELGAVVVAEEHLRGGWRSSRGAVASFREGSFSAVSKLNFAGK